MSSGQAAQESYSTGHDGSGTQLPEMICIFYSPVDFPHMFIPKCDNTGSNRRKGRGHRSQCNMLTFAAGKLQANRNLMLRNQFTQSIIRELIILTAFHASVTGSDLNRSALKRSRGKEEITPGEVKVKDGGVLGEVVAQQEVLAVPPHVRIVRHIHLLQCCLVHQLSKIPDSDCTI